MPQEVLDRLESRRRQIHTLDPLQVAGKVTQASSVIVESMGPTAAIGDVCEIHSRGRRPMLAEVVGFRENTVLSMPIYNVEGVQLGDKVVSLGKQASVKVGKSLLGRVIDGNGQPLDGKGPIKSEAEYSLNRFGYNPLNRTPINRALGTGVRAIDSLLTIGTGQRVGIFGGSGVGKSTLLGMMSRYTEADVNVIALVGERGREVRGFVERDLGPSGLERSVVVVATSDNAPLMRIRAALTAAAIAEYFCDQKKHVLLVMDSVTRMAMAQREVGLAAGEPPSSKGYTPSVFGLLPRLFERAGNFSHGSITGFYTVLVEGDDFNEPISDAVRGLLDGHIVLSRALAWKNHFPSIDIMESLSRLMPELVDREHLERAGRLRELLSTYSRAEDMINIGAYAKGSNPAIDRAIEKIEPINEFLKQPFNQSVSHEDGLQALRTLTEP